MRGLLYQRYCSVFLSDCLANNSRFQKYADQVDLAIPFNLIDAGVSVIFGGILGALFTTPARIIGLRPDIQRLAPLNFRQMIFLRTIQIASITWQLAKAGVVSGGLYTVGEVTSEILKGKAIDIQAVEIVGSASALNAIFRNGFPGPSFIKIFAYTTVNTLINLLTYYGNSLH